MNCRVCGNPMRSGEVDGRPGYACLPCGKTLVLPQGGPTAQHPTTTRQRTQRTAPAIVGSAHHMSEGECSFLEKWTEYHPDLECRQEYNFSLTRNWRVDFAWPDVKVAVEYEGFGHGRKNRYDADVDKYNNMAYEGWVLYRLTKDKLNGDIERFCRMVAATILSREKLQ